MNDFLSHIDQIQESSSWHVLDFIPFQPKNPDFLHYEQFLETGNYVQDFARRICFISLTLIAEYEAKLYLTENETFFKLHPDLKPLHNIRELPYQKLDEIIKEVIVNDLSSLQIFFTDENVLLSIDGALQVTLYNACGSFLETLRLLVQQNGLFLKCHNGSDIKIS